MLRGCLPLATAFTFSAVGCTLPAGTYTTARALPAGRVQHGAVLEVAPYLDEARSEHSDVEPIERDSRFGLPVQPGYTLRGGLGSGFELSSKMLLGSFDVSLKWQVIDTERFALALAPRGQTGGLVYGMSPYYAELPLLATLQFGRVSFTPRGAIGYAGALRGDFFDDWYSGPRLATPVVLAGLFTLVRITPLVSAGLDAYWLRALSAPVQIPGGGFVVLFTPGSE